MERGNGIKSCWERGKSVEGAYASLNEKDFDTIVASRVRKQFKAVAEYVWAALVYQIILYSFLAHTLVHEWGHAPSMFLCFAGGALYVPLSVALIRRVRRLFSPSTMLESNTNISCTLEQEYARFNSFFRFKRRMDWVGVPVSCAIIAFVTLTLFGNGMSGNVIGGLVLFAIWVGLSIVAVHAENKKRFIAPLHHLERLLEDLKRS